MRRLVWLATTVVTMAILAAALFAAPPMAMAAEQHTNSDCLRCHDLATANMSFAVAPVDRSTVC